jgi:glycosyltransferase involved in cell wall biosynthesis
MKILYITPRINDAGGLSRIISIKANYLIEHFDYKIHILTQNKGNFPLFYNFSDKIVLHDMVLKNNSISKLYSFISQTKKNIQLIKPDIIILCEGFKGFFIPWFISLKIPVLFEVHGSILNSESKPNTSFISSFKFKSEIFIKKKLARKFTKLIVLSEESEQEWKTKNTFVLANPNWLKSTKTSNLQNKKAIMVARHSYEKGIDSALYIWQKVIEKHPNWILEVYGDFDKNLIYQNLANKLQLQDNIVFFEPVKNIEEKYIEASFCLMTSRTEGFGMVLVEAMTCGLPCIAYNCPVGPKVIIKNDYNGFLINEGNTDEFVLKVFKIIENKDLLKEMSENGITSSKLYDLDTIMGKWNTLLKTLCN